MKKMISAAIMTENFVKFLNDNPEGSFTITIDTDGAVMCTEVRIISEISNNATGVTNEKM